ncbi:MAG: sugar phosphate isomerase/epimerase [Verrucomicrobiales bacterium]|nr:sugar phosphate isomerase/epimerase [Verrucomicrobiales bacterium]
MNRYPRRQFLAAAALAPAALALPFARAAENPRGTASAGTLKGRFYKTLKIGMIRDGSNLSEKFAIAKQAGFDGVELNAPGYDVDEVRKAIAATGLPVDGTVCADHWGVRHSDPDPAVRQKALETLLAALEATHAVGGHTVLLVVGHGKDGSHEEVWSRSVENIRQAIPLAARLGVGIAVENVWNEFCYDHAGGADQTADLFARYIDEFSSPWVGMQFDIGNHWKYGNAGDWIRTLGKRITKLDVKGFSRADNKFTPIDEGDIDYPDVVKALLEIGFHGWCAAEVGGGDLAYLTQVASAMDRSFGLV